MATKPLVGGYTWGAALAEMQAAADAQRYSLEKMMQPGIGENQRTVHLSKIIYSLATIYKGINELREIGQAEKAERNGE